MAKFIEVHIVSQRPGNPVVRGFVRADDVKSFNVASDELAKIGAACTIDNLAGSLYVTESIDEIYEALNIALRDT
jgi:hypothetical protein